MDIINIAYAIQVCDIQNREVDNRVCGNDRTLLSKKSIRSFLNSVEYCANKHKNITHTIKFFSDRSTRELINFIEYCITKINKKNISASIEHLQVPGITNSIFSCYKWLNDNGKDFVYQIQDDYLFNLNAITELIELQLQLKIEVNEYGILTPLNDNYNWLTQYRNKVTPRAVVCTKYRYWIQIYDISCSFLLHYNEFIRHWDLYNDFFAILDKKEKNLENRSVNYILTRRGKLGLAPINTLAFHLQSEVDIDPYISWKPLWESVNVNE